MNAPPEAFEHEIRDACDWLERVRPRSGAARWGWLQDVPPNAQNTAEVVIGLSQAGRLDEGTRDDALDYLIESLDDTDCNIRDRGWVARAFAEVGGAEEIERLNEPERRCLDWIAEQQNDDGGGWGDRRGELSLVPTTALAVEALHERQQQSAAKGIAWLLANQEKDGGWSLTGKGGGVAPAGLTAEGTRAVQRARGEANAACTAIAARALLHTGGPLECVERAADWLLKHRTRRLAGDPTTGGWPVFRERGVRAGEWYTFRHFSTARAVLVLSELYEDRFVESADGLEALEYLLCLQEKVPRKRRDEGGGWRCSIDGDAYTWATVNAITALVCAGRYLNPTSGSRRVDGLRYELALKDSGVVRVPAEAPRQFAFNAPSMLVCSALVTALAGAWLEAEIRTDSDKAVVVGMGALAGLIVAVPWSAYFALRSSAEDPPFRTYLGWTVGTVLAIVGLAAALTFQ